MVVLAAASMLTDARKGIDLLLDAMKHVEVKSLKLALLGKGAAELAVEMGEMGVALGETKSNEETAEVFRAADLLVHPARIDNYPNTISEAQACGTPVVAYGVGGVPEMVADGETGWIISDVSATALRNAVSRILANAASLKQMRAACRKRATVFWDPVHVAERYVEFALESGTKQGRVRLAGQSEEGSFLTGTR